MMIKNFEDVQKLSKDGMDATMKSFGALSKVSQAIATELADYSKKSFEDSTKLMEKLFGAKSLDKAFEVQTEFAKTAYEGFVAEAAKIGELYADLAKETYKPFEGFIAKAGAMAKKTTTKFAADWNEEARPNAAGLLRFWALCQTDRTTARYAAWSGSRRSRQRRS